MSVVHYQVEVFYDTIFQPLCENQAGRDAVADCERDVEMTDRDEEVTCKKCLKALGYEIEPARHVFTERARLGKAA
ncbi:MAG: hypothetical protein ACR652_17580 [Methylocystis sp.]|uniref:hypothetical protein n=1 Tax=Methylocystis sp. TaxID=1911079 RepID=UPI003DA63515